MDPPNSAAPALELTAWILPGTVAVSELIDQGRGVISRCRARIRPSESRGHHAGAEHQLAGRVSHRFGSPVTTRTYDPLVNRMF
jgi:hypothetical protein